MKPKIQKHQEIAIKQAFDSFLERKNQLAQLALEVIKQMFGTKAAEDSIGTFIEHHIDVLPPAYWKKHLGTKTPEPMAVLGLLQLENSTCFDASEGSECFDFTLPDKATNYIIAVSFDKSGKIKEISMDS